MSYEARTDSVVEEIRKGRDRYVPFVTDTEDREIVFASTLDEAVMFFVTLPRRRLQEEHARPAPSEPFDEE